MHFQRSIQPKRHINITPLIDVVFLLVVFFMLTSTFVSYEAIELNVQSDSGYAPYPPPKLTKPIHIKVLGENSYTIYDMTFDNASLSSYLAPRIRRHAKEQILVDPVDKAPIQAVVSVMDIIRRLGGKNLSLVEGK